MSRYFDLMQASEREQAAQAQRRGEPLPPSPDDSAALVESLDTGLPWTGSGHSLVTVPRLRVHQPKSPQVSILRFLAEACFRHPRTFLGVAGATLLLTMLAILLTPRRYQATMQLMVLNSTGSDANAQAELLYSRDLLGQVLDQTGGPVSPQLARDRAMDALGRTLRMAPARGSNLLQVSYKDSSPERARDVLQAVATSFVNRELALLHPMRQKLSSELVEQRQRELTAAQQDLASFESTTGVAALGEFPLNPSDAPSVASDPWQERVAAAQRNLDLETRKRDQARVDDALERERIWSIAVAAKPSASSIPVQPRPGLFLACGLPGAVFLALGVCALIERKRSTVYSPAELEALTGLTTLATVPMQQFEVRN